LSSCNNLEGDKQELQVADFGGNDFAGDDYRVGEDDEFLADDDIGGYVIAAGGDGQSPATGNGTNDPSDWNNVSPNHVMGRLKLLKAEVLDRHDLRPFYKSYSNWEKMTREQQNKAVAWFRKLPDDLKGKYILIFFIYLFSMFSCLKTEAHGTVRSSAPLILETAKAEQEKVSEEAVSTAAVTTKDDIARLIHLFKFPGAQGHWTNHYGVLNRVQLDACRTAGAASDAANPLSCLVEIFNDYAQFTP
jgi:hypothetical protein